MMADKPQASDFYQEVSKVLAAAEADVNSADFGRIERLDRKPSRRIAAFLSQKYRLPIEQLLAPYREPIFA